MRKMTNTNTATATMTRLSPSAGALRLFFVSTFLVRWGTWGYIIPNTVSPKLSRSLSNGQPQQHTHPSTHTIANALRQRHHRQGSRSSSSSTTRLLVETLWERMNLVEDDEPMWYLLNCVAGNEMELQQQCRTQFKYLILDPADRDAIKFVVPTITSTRSHGAKRMVQDTKVKYPGYVFVHVRLTEQTYEALQAIPLMRSFMGGGINMKGFKKLPPVPIPLTYEEIEKYGLEEIEYTDEDVEAAKFNQDNLEIIVDTEELEQEEIATESAIEEIVQTVYNGLRVEDMIKVTAKNKFHGEDGTVRRLKDGKVKIRFFTYGQAYEEWLDPTDVRKMSDAEAMRGLTEGAPITQNDIDGGQGQGRSRDRGRDGGRQEYSNRRNEVGNFGGGPRNRRQDRTASRYSDRKGDDGEDNWKWYQDNERRQDESSDYIEDGDFQIRGSKHRRDSRREGYSPESDVNSQWGRPPSQRQERRDRRERGGDRSMSQRQNNMTPSRQENDDFFESLMADLTNDLEDDNEGRRNSGAGGSNQNNSNNGGGDDDDFFATLMSEISESNDNGSSNSDSSRKKNTDINDGEDDDFFASLEREIQGTTSKPHLKKNEKSASPNEILDDIFAQLDINVENDKDATTTDFSDDSEDFFSSLEAELASELGHEPSSERTSKGQALSDSENNDTDDFFSKLDEELGSDRKPSKSDSSSNSATNKSVDVDSLTVPQLKEMLRERGLKVSGKKAELIERLNSLA